MTPSIQEKLDKLNTNITECIQIALFGLCKKEGMALQEESLRILREMEEELSGEEVK